MRPFYTPCLRVIFALVLSLLGMSAFAATFTVTNLLDSGAGSLRQAIIDANAAGAGPHSIVFSTSGIIPIGSPLPAITNADITIDGGNNITVDAQGGNINRDIFTLNNGANNTIIKNITLEGTGTEAIQINGNLTGVTIENVIIQSKNGGECNCINHGIYVGGTATNMMIKSVTVKDLQYGATWGVRFLKTVTNLEIDDLVVEDNGGGDSRGIQFQGVVNNVDILNTIIDMDDKNSGNDGNYGIYFNTTTTDVTINNLTVSDAEIYSLYFGGVATNPTIENSTFDNLVGGNAYPMIRFNNTVNNLDIDNITVNADFTGSTNDHNYGIYFNGAVQTASITDSDFIEADIAGMWFNGTNKDNITISDNTFTKNGIGADTQGGLIFTNTRNTTSDAGPVLVQSNTFYANNGEAIAVHPGNGISYVIPNFTITDNTIYNTKSNYGAINVQYVDKINITNNSIYNNRGRGIELTYSGNCNYQSPNVPTIVSSTPTMSGYDVVITLPSICATGCDVEVFVTKPQYYGVGGEVYVTTLMGATSGTNTYSIACMDALCTGAPYGVWTANLKVTSKNCGTSEFSNKLAVQPNGPACVSSGVKLWLRADLGLYNQDLDVPYTDGQTVGFWEEFSGGGGPSSNYRHSASYIQLSGMNFNPVVQQPRLQGSSGSVDWMTTANTTTVAVMNPGNTASGTRLFSTRYSSYDYDDNREMLVFYRTGNNIHSYRGRTLLQPGATNAFNSAGVFSAVTTASNYSMKYNGTNLGSTNYSKGTLNARTWTMGLGAAPGWCCGSGANVLFPEVITYNRELNATELQKVHTYLAVKYGITLTQDYIASNDAVWWDISDNTGYNNGIAGLARDDCSIFEQKQSKSESMDDVVTIAVGDSIASNNIENEASIPANSSAFIWGNNNLTTAFDETFVNPYADSRMKRVWRVRKTAWTDQNITVCLEKGNSNKTLIISNSDPTFATVTHFFPLNNDGCVTVNSSNFMSGAYFTFSNQVVGPNCATTGIRLWLRGDIGFTAGANPWVDFSGYDVVNTVNGSVAAGTMNYNTAADFTGNRVYDIALNINPTVNDPITVYTVYEADALSRDLWGNDNGGWDRFQRMFDVSGNGAGPDYVGGNVTGRTIINGAVLDDGPTNGSYVYIDGKQVLQFTNANSNGGLTKLYLGDINGGGHFDGRIGEFVVYQGALDATTRNKVESYLALKYGVTLDQSAGSGGTNYVDSDGDPYWTADASNIYENDIAGLGRDDCTNLYQKQSKSVNDDALISFALGDEFMTNNNLNTNTIAADQSFFVWANNNQSTNFDQTVSNPNIVSTVRMGRIWQVQKTNWTDQVVTLCFSGDATNTNLLISADPTFATGVEELVLDESTGCVGLNTSLIADNAYLTFAKEFKGPACVNAGVKLWLRSDAGVALSGANLSTWQDQSGRGNHSTTTNGTVVYNENNLNFYPSFNFSHSGTDGINGPNLGMSGDNSYGIVFVTQPNNAVNDYDVFSIADGYSGVVDYSTASGGRLELSYNNGGITAGGVSSLLAQPHIFGFNSNANGTGYLNGTTGSSRTPGTLASSTRTYKIGDFLANGDGLGMDFAEVVVYDVTLSATELQRINSYMALKYGITLNNGATDYLASDGVTTMWKASDNVGYGQDIAGIGLDQCTDLHQKQSKSVNSDALITMAVGDSVASSNATNLNEVLVDNTFLVWSNNGASTVIDQSVTKMSINSTMRMSRIWKVDKSDEWSDIDITICIPQMGERYLLIDKNSAGFDNDGNTVEYRFDFAKSCITINSSELPDGAYFTLSTKISGPACVDNGIQNWLRADYGTGTTTQGGTVSSWVDFSGNTNNATGTGDPSYDINNAINFNPVIYYDGNDAHNLANSVSGNYSIFTISRMEGPDDQRVFQSQTGNVLMGYHGGTEDDLYLNAWLNNSAKTATTDVNMYSLQRTTASGGYEFRGEGHVIKSGTGSQNVTWKMNIGGTLTYNEASRVYVAEMAIYNQDLTAQEVQKIESYLAIKYGLTLATDSDGDNIALETTPINEGDYVDSDGNVIWDASVYSTYHNDVAGIGRDDCTELYQKQSKSASSDALVTMALGDEVQLTNEDNDFTINVDQTFLLWGNNNGATDFTTSLAGAEATTRMSRVWRVEKSAAWEDTEIMVCFSGQDALSFLVINNSSAAFATVDAEHRLDATGCVNILSSDLPDGAYFTVGRELYGPACVNAGIKTWLRADDGYTPTTGPWDDYSGNDNHATVIAGTPSTGSINFNQAADFGGSANFQIPLNTRPDGMSTLSTFVVYQADVASRTIFGNDNGAANDRSLYMNTICPGCTGITGINVTGQSKLVTTVWQQGVTNGTYVLGDSKEIYRATKTASNDGATVTWLGRGYSGIASGSYFDGRIAEFIIYNTNLTAVEQQRIHSYLALKYGITIDQTTNTDYVASDWNGTTGTKMWVNDNDGYEYNIAGIGKDICTGLHQKQSKSVNTGAMITMALGTSLAADNASNTESVTNDKTFLTWSHNNLSSNFNQSVSLSGIGSTTRMERVWKVDKSSSWADQDITICISQSGERYLLIDSETDAGDGIFNEVANVTEYVLDVSTGCVTINSADLPDGAYFTLGLKIAGPACVDSGIKAWFRADYGASASGWVDFSGNNVNTVATGTGNDPAVTETINFNPAIDFDGNDIFTANIASGFSGNQSYTIYSVFNPSNTNNQNLFAIGTPALRQNVAYHPSSGGNRLLYHFSDDLAGTGALAGWQLGGFQYDNSLVGNDRFMYSNGALIAQNNAGTLNVPSNPLMSIGGYSNRTGSGGEELVGDIAELVVYNTVLTATERQKVESYLALKYGITLDQSAVSGGTNYLASDGTAYWTADATDTYEHDIAGMGRDSCTDLHQKQSKSVNSDDIVTMALGDAVAASNAANLNLIPVDKSFLVWANNNGNFDFGADATGTNATARTNRIWRVQKTANWEDQTITVCFTGYNDTEYLLISNSDPLFGTVNAEHQLDANGCVSFDSGDLPDDAYFTLGRALRGPACVNGGIKLWLRADDVAIGNLVNALGWTDYSNNENDFTTVVSDPANISGSLNYNNYVEFDGGDYLSKPSISSAFTEGEVFTVVRTRSNTGHAYAFGGESNNHYRTDDTYENFGTNSRVGWRNSTNAVLDGSATINPVIFEPENWNVYSVYAAPSDWAASFNGYTKAKNNTNVVNFNADATNYIGRGELDILTGDVGEVILYSRKLTDAERQKVQSYLALKYGITLSGDNDGDGTAFETGAINEGDYVASNDAVFWDASANSTYHNDVAGIGRDSCTGLLQKQSASINTGSVVRMALGDAFEADNISNTATITADHSFLLWGSNGMNTTFGTSVDYSTTNMYNSTVRMNRVWKVQKTNWTDQNITLCFSQSGERYLLVDEDGGSFEDDANTKEYTLNFVTGCITFNSSSLPNNATFTLGTEITGPACVNAGIQVWLRADYNATGAQWTDFSGNGRNATQGTPGNQAIFTSSATNFNPAMTFNGSKSYDFTTGLNSTDPSTFIFVSRTNTISTSYQALAELGNDRPGLYWRSGRANNYTFDVTTPDMLHSSVFTANDPAIFTFGSNNANTKNFTIGANGIQESFTGADGTYSLGTGATGAKLGDVNSGTGIGFNGDMNEVVVYNRVLTSDERQQIESYLALKYGITLDVPAANADYDYVSYNGTSEVVMWSAVNNFGYHNDIAGIGREDCTELHQRQSKSVNGDDPVTIAMGDAVAATNATNPSDVGTDRTFLVWGNNDGVLDFLDDVEGATNASARLDRIWKVDKSATWQDDGITICFTSTYANQYLLIDNDADFSSVSTEAVLDANGCASISSAALLDGAYFTVGKALMGPACVDGGIRLWLRGDAGVTDASSIISQWNDQSGNGGHVTPVAATKEPLVFTGNATTNYNPSLTFDGVNDELYNTTYDPWSANTDGTVFVSFKSRATNVRKFFSTGADGDDPAFGVDGASANGLRVFHDASVPTSITSTDAYIDDQSTVGAFTWATGANQGIEIRTNGKSFVNATVDMVTFDPTDMFIGSSDAAEFWLGEINEVVIYNRKLSAVEIQKVESYLALKYGTTLDQATNTNYIATDGSNMWENDNDGFEHDIAGLGKDECTGLHQKQSSSVNADDVVTFAMGDAVAATNVDNANAVTNDLSFFTWANDNGNTDVFSTAVTATNAELRMARIWKVDKFNWEDQDITICFDGQIGERYLLIDNNSATLASVDQEIALDPLTGCATFSSVELGHGYYFSLGTKILAPGCADNADILTWLRADYGATPAQWNDFSGRTTHATSVNQPATGGAINFNPTMNFAGDDFYTISGLDINYTVTDRDPITVLTVYQPDVTGRGVWGNDNSGFDRYLNTDVVSDGNANAAYSGGNTIGQTSLVTSILDEGTANGSFVFADGQRTLTFTQSGSGGGITGTYLGDNNGTNTANTAFDGRIAEFAVYRGALTDAQRQQAESYLALKYGITLSTDNNGNSTALEVISGSITEGDYVASDGTTVYWDASANSTYHNDVAGIGQDMCTALNQKQSRSANSDYLVTMALGSAVEATNAANTNTFTNDLAYLVWGNDSGITTFNTAVSGTNVNSRLGRVWKVQKSANWDDDQDITLCFNGGYNEENYLIISDANTFATLDLEQALDANGCITINSALLENGDFFSLGVEVSGPACVNPGISMWLRADAGTVDGTSWLDQSGKNVNATGVNPPTLTTGAINFNPAMVFDGTNDYMTLSSLDVLPYNSSNRTIIGIGYSTNVTGIRSIMSYGTATNNTNQRIGQDATDARYSSGTVAGQFVDVAGFWTVNVPSILSTSYEDLAPDVASIYKDGKSLSNTDITTPWNTASSGAVGRIGANAAASAAEFWSGGIGELIIYDRTLSALELQQVHSYLSLKYGITLDQTVPQDYVASDGLTLMWEAASNAGYTHDISGIGLDGCTGLNQKQSRSVNSDAVITMGLGSIASDNANNSNVFDSDLSFMVWGNNNGSLSEITTDLPAQFSVGAYRLGREWKVDETNTVGVVQVKANLNMPPLAGAISGSVASEIRLLIDRDGDGDFTTGVVDIITASDYSSGIATFDNVDFQDGDVFTVGTKLPDVSLSVKVLLQGAAIGAGAGMMRNDLQTFGMTYSEPDILPITDPYQGTSMYADINNPAGVVGTLVDWVEVQIRSAADPNTILERKSLLLQTDGDVVEVDGSTPKFSPQGAAVHIVVRHRQHLAVMSNSIGVFQNVVSYDFTTGLSQAHKVDSGDPDMMVQVNGHWTLWAGDAVHDAFIDANDFGSVNTDVIQGIYGQYLSTDVYMDGFLDANDYGLTNTNLGIGSYSALAYYNYP